MSLRDERSAETRKEIVRAAAALLRDQGVAGMSIQRAMAGAGLTVGAFYAHFADKNDLLEESFAQAMREIGIVAVEKVAGRTGRAPLRDVANFYLSEAHRDNPVEGCALPAVAGAAASGPSSVQALLIKGVHTMVQRLYAVGAGEVSLDAAHALVVVMVGGQVLARASKGARLSDRILAVCRTTATDILVSPSFADKSPSVTSRKRALP